MLINFLVKFFTIVIFLGICFWVYIILTATPTNQKDWETLHAVNSYIEISDHESYVVRNYRDYAPLDVKKIRLVEETKTESFRDFRKKYYQDINFNLREIEALYLITPKNEYNKKFPPFVYFKLKNKESFGVAFFPRKETAEKITFIGSLTKKHEIFSLISAPKYLIDEINTGISETPTLLALPLNLSLSQKKTFLKHITTRTTELNQSPEFYNYFSNNEHLEYNNTFRAVFPREITKRSFSRTKITDILYGAKIVDKPTPVDISKYIFNPEK